MPDKPNKRLTKPIRLGLIGCGGIVQKSHCPSYLNIPDFVKVVALADLVPENLQGVGSVLDVPPTQRYSDYRDMLEKAEIDAVTIATPHYLHAEHAIEAAEAGVAIISEKPMATSLEEADEILSTVQRNNVPYTVVHNFLSLLPLKEAFAQLHEGKVGKPIFSRGQFTNLKPADISGTTNWRASKAAGGGCLIDTAYHEIYTVEALMGSPVQYVEARVKTLSLNIDVDDIVMMLFEHQNGTISTVSASWCFPAIERMRWWEVHTTDGSLRVNQPQPMVRPDDPRLFRFTREEGAWKALYVPGGKEQALKDPLGHAGFFASVFEALARGSEMPVTAEQARHHLAIIEAAMVASEQRRAIEVE